ncbi:MAG: hypothetical protein U0936_14690 [Planctomycetaceae bacterium]
MNGKSIACRTVVSNANIKSTIQNLVGEQHLDKKFLDDAKAVRLRITVRARFSAAAETG